MSAQNSDAFLLLTETDAARVIESDGDFSLSLREILRAAALPHGRPTTPAKKASKSASSAYWLSPFWWSLLAVLHASGQTRVGAQGAARIFNTHSEFITSLTEDEVRNHTRNYNLGTSEVGTALQDALEIRHKTGGNDEHIGLRHALFSILLPPEPSVFSETYEILAEAGTSPVRLAESIAEFCLDKREPQEDISVWQALIDERLSKLEALNFAVTSGRQVATPGADDPWAEGKVDRSGAQLEADAFASMICWKDFSPPLAVGVFGDWGKGKSFFMRLVHDAIEGRTKDKDGFLDHVVQIRFNAWHYAETNLWASLVDHIFSELDAWAEREHKSPEQVFARLDTARDWTLAAAEDLMARRQLKKEAEANLDAANSKLTKKMEELAGDPNAWRKGVWDAVLTDDLVPSYKTALQDLGLTSENTEGLEDLRQAIALYNPETGGAVAKDWWRLLGNHKTLSVFLVLALFGLPIALAALMSHWDSSGVGGAVAGVVTPVVAAMAIISRTLNTAHAKLGSAHAKVQSQIDQRTAKEARNRARAEAELATAELEMEAAKNSLRETEAALRAAEIEFQAETGKGRILKFVRERITSGDYRKQLSFIAQIRRDFDELSILMNDEPAPKTNEDRRQQHKKRVEDLIKKADAYENSSLLEPEEINGLRETYEQPAESDDEPVFERIVLYIDDLDRCPAEQVVVVLQAIHLLLAYPLFVVFVAVDVRWLQQALEDQYEQFKDTNGPDAHNASASDYLEKIFQVPYWVRAMTPENTSDLLTDLMATPAQNESELQQPDAAEETKPLGSEPKPLTDKADIATLREDVDNTPGVQTVKVEPPSPVQLEFSVAEAEFVRALSRGLDGSPRRTLRFVNSYRLIKASLALTQHRRLAEGGYRSILALLAVQVCSEDIEQNGGPQNCFHALAEKLSTDPQGLEVWADDLPECAPKERLRAVLAAFFDEGGQSSELEEHVAVVARFSFAQY